jgi:hypothetical protein
MCLLVLQIVEMKLLTPAHGAITLSPTANTALFGLAKVGLGSLGVVSEVTLRCIPKLQLREVTRVYTRQSIAGHTDTDALPPPLSLPPSLSLLSSDSHYQRLMTNRHVRYMWLPYTDTVVSVTSKKVDDGDVSQNLASEDSCAAEQPSKSMVDLLRKCRQGTGTDTDTGSGSGASVTEEEEEGEEGEESPEALQSHSVAHLRDLLLEFGPLSVTVCE